MSPHLKPTTRAGKSFPRVSGDEPQVALALVQINGFSPRERG